MPVPAGGGCGRWIPRGVERRRHPPGASSPQAPWCRRRPGGAAGGSTLLPAVAADVPMRRRARAVPASSTWGRPRTAAGCFGGTWFTPVPVDGLRLDPPGTYPFPPGHAAPTYVPVPLRCKERRPERARPRSPADRRTPARSRKLVILGVGGGAGEYFSRWNVRVPIRIAADPIQTLRRSLTRRSHAGCWCAPRRCSPDHKPAHIWPVQPGIVLAPAHVARRLSRRAAPPGQEPSAHGLR